MTHGFPLPPHRMSAPLLGPISNHSLDHLVGPQEKHRQQRQSQDLGGLHDLLAAPGRGHASAGDLDWWCGRALSPARLCSPGFLIPVLHMRGTAEAPLRCRGWCWTGPLCDREETAIANNLCYSSCKKFYLLQPWRYLWI